ncbi:MAG TPA: hypothetical protein VFR35_10375 [Actinoplanes sp.]|nr:hypothetical protein [Actinoplanes sp.]
MSDRSTFAHDAALVMDPGGDVRAPGGAITTALCGHWEHEPPCPLAPHYTYADREGDRVRLHVLFATAPDREDEVRRRIEGALDDPRWRLLSAGPGVVAAAEAGHAARLADG